MSLSKPQLVLLLNLDADLDEVHPNKGVLTSKIIRQWKHVVTHHVNRYNQCHKGQELKSPFKYCEMIDEPENVIASEVERMMRL